MPNGHQSRNSAIEECNADLGLCRMDFAELGSHGRMCSLKADGSGSQLGSSVITDSLPMSPSGDGGAVKVSVSQH